MKFLTITTLTTLLAGSLGARFGNIRLLEAYNCLEYDANGACTKCIPRTYLKDGDCKAISDLCKDWDTVTGACTSCYGGYSLKDEKCSYDSSQDGSSQTSSGTLNDCPASVATSLLASNPDCVTFSGSNCACTKCS